MHPKLKGVVDLSELFFTGNWYVDAGKLGFVFALNSKEANAYRGE